MDNLIGLINNLQDVFAGVDDRFALELPQIAVVGCQSAGKSSVLENIVGKDFLPRGSGIVTRRPLILQLIHRSEIGVEYGEFLHKRNQYFHDFQEIKREIESETERICGANKGLSSSPIHLRIFSDQVIDLTLIDLPGMTKVPIGDQPPDIEIQIRKLIFEFVEQPNCLILAVSPANCDLANSDALQLAQQVDPHGLRTIGVITKLDLMDQGTDARAVLKNEVIPLRYGYIGVVNRSQKDIDGQKDIQSALQFEESFFSMHPSYSDLADRMGTSYLRRALHFHLTRHIGQSLPDLRSKIEHQSINLQRRLTELRPSDQSIDYDDPYWKPKTLVISVIKFSQECRIDLLGNSNENNFLKYDRLSCGARIHRLFHDKYPAMLDDVEFAKEMEMKREIGFAIQNIIGIRTSLFTPDKAFDQIIRMQIGKLREPTLRLIEMVSSDMMKAIDAGVERLNHFPALARHIESLVSNYVLHRMDRTRQAANELLDYEYAYINAKHEDFVGFKHAESTADRIVCERKNPGMQVLKSGWLTLSTPQALSRSHKFWFVLTPDNLSWYADATLQECKYRIPLADGRLRFFDHEKNNEFSLTGDSEKWNIYKDCNRLDFSTPSFEQFDQWRIGFMRVGVFCESNSSSTAASYVNKTPISAQILDTNDPHLERQIEIIWVLIASYMRIVCRTLEDMIPKVIVRVLIKDTIEYLEKTFVADVSRLQNVDELLEENSHDVEERSRIQKMLTACQLAMEKLREIQIPLIDGVFYDTSLARNRQNSPPPNRPTAPPRPPALKQGREFESAARGKFRSHETSGEEGSKNSEKSSRRSGSVPNRNHQRPEKIDEEMVAKRKSTVATDKVSGQVIEGKKRERASYRAPKAKLTVEQIQKAQSQIDSSQKSTFFI